MLLQKLKELKSIEFINYGGCVISAYYIYKYIRKYYPKSEIPQIIFLYSYIDHRYKSNKRNTRKLYSCYHCVVKWRGNYYDSDGIYNPTGYGQLHITPLYALRAFNNAQEWNSRFDRKQVKLIEKILK